VETDVYGIERLRVRLIGYTRSSDAREQAESHASQETTIRAWARAHGHRIVRVISEPAGTRAPPPSGTAGPTSSTP
jgi:hypothetical protein